MAEITAGDRANLTKLRMFAGPELAAFAEKMMKGKGQNEALDRAGNAFEAQASDWRNMAKLKALNEQFKQNPQLAGKMEQLLKENPQAFEKHVGRMFANPDQTLTIVEEQIQTKPVVPAPTKTPIEAVQILTADPADPKPKIYFDPQKNPGQRHGSSPGSHVERTPEKAPSQPLTVSSPDAEITLDSAAKFAEISKASGFDGLMERINKNPHLQDMFKGMTDGDPNKSSEMIDTLHEQIKADPDFLNKVNKTIDNTPPGTMSTVASLIANDSRSGFAAFGILNGLQNSGMGSLLQTGMGMGLMNQILPMISKMMQFFTGSLDKVKGFVTGHLKDSRDVMAQESKSGMTVRALDAVTGNPASVTIIDPQTGAATRTSAEAIKQGAPPDVPKPPQFNREKDITSPPQPAFGGS